MDGWPYTNSGNHIIRWRRFRAVSIHATLAAAVWDRACDRMVANAIGEAGAPPVQD